MENSLTIALARQTVLSRQMDVIATNLANITTSGYKAEQMIFTEVIETTTAGEFISLVHDVGFVRDLSAGPMTETDNPLDMAIHGEGFFVIQTPDGDRYTRHGVYLLDPTGRIVNTEGHPLLGSGGTAITIPIDTSRVSIARDGTVSADAQDIGQIKIVRFADERALTKIGSGLFDAKTQIPEPATDSQVIQGMIETSNVKGVTEMTQMIDTVRAYQAAAKLADTEHQLILDAIEALTASSI